MPGDENRPRWFRDYMLDTRTAKRSPHTQAAIRQDFDAIAGLLAGAVPLHQLTPQMLTKSRIRAAFAAYSDTHAPASVRRCASTWNGLCDYLYQEDLIVANPVRAVKLPKRPAQTPKSLTVTQVADLLAAAGQFDDPPRSWPQLEQLIVHLGGITGARAAEMAGINIGDIRLSPDGPVLDLRGKGNQPRPVPFEPALLTHIEDYLTSRSEVFPGSVPARRRTAARPLGFYKPTDPLLVGADGERITVPTMQYRLSRLFKRAGITPPRGALLHALRHTFATTLADAGADVYKLRDLLGHTSIATTQTYIKAAGQHNRETAATNPLYGMIDAAADD